MSMETEIAQLMRNDNTLIGILTGGVWTDEEVGVEGLRRGEDSYTNAAFDPNTGILLPCAVVRERGIDEYGDIRAEKGKVTGTSQVAEIYYYQFRGHSLIDAAKLRAYYVLEAERLSFGYPIRWGGDSPHLPDVGPVQNSTTVRQVWQLISVRSMG